MLEVVLEITNPCDGKHGARLRIIRAHQLEAWLAASLEGAAARKDESLSRKLAAARDRNEGALEVLRGAGERMLQHVLETIDPHQLGEWLAAPLEGAAAQGDEGLSKKLIQAGAEMRGVVLHHAIRGGNVAVVDMMLEKGVPLDNENMDDENAGELPLGTAAQCGNVEIAQALLRKGADINAEDLQHRPPLSYAMEKGHITMVEALLTAGADLTLCYGEGDFSLLHDAVVSAGDTRNHLNEEYLNIVRMLINHGVAINSESFEGHTALHMAAKYDRVGAVHVLVEAGADINAGTNRFVFNPLHAAADGVAPDSCLALLEYGADVNDQTDRGRTALHLAASKGAHKHAVEVVDILLRWGADETAVCKEGKTAPSMVGTRYVYRGHTVPENTERVRNLLARAPADRAWRRRGLMALCRAYPDRVRLGGDLAGLTATVLALVEDGVFRKIVGYL